MTIHSCDRQADRERQKLLHTYDGRVLIKHCVRHGATQRPGAGDHVIVRAPNGLSQPFPSRTIGHGLQSKLVKWMIGVGLALLGVGAWVGGLL